MSWGVSTGLCSPDEVEAKVEALELPDTVKAAQAECGRQLEAGKLAAVHLFNTEVLGSSDRVSITISGHSRPEHDSNYDAQGPEFISVVVARG
jgi:hypothetical protein